MMRNTLTSLCLCLGIGIAAWSDAGRSADSDQAPDFALASLAGPNYRLSEYRGEVVAVTFWAKWCGACSDELAGLELTRQQFDSGFQVLGISLDRKPADARELAGSLGISFPTLLDEARTVGKLYELEDLPATLIVDQRGVVRWRYAGKRTRGDAGYQDHVSTLLNE